MCGRPSRRDTAARSMVRAQPSSFVDPKMVPLLLEALRELGVHPANHDPDQLYAIFLVEVDKVFGGVGRSEGLPPEVLTDAKQDVLLSLTVSLFRGQIHKSISHFVRGALKKRAEYLRNKGLLDAKRTEPLGQRNGEPEHHISVGPEPCAHENEQQLEQIRLLMSEVHPEYLSVLRLHAAGLSLRDIAEELNTTKAKVEPMLAAARRQAEAMARRRNLGIRPVPAERAGVAGIEPTGYGATDAHPHLCPRSHLVDPAAREERCGPS